MTTVGIIVNPHAGKDIRRLVSSAGHTPDSVKIGVVRRAIAGAFEAGATRILLSDDTHHLGMRAADGLDAPVETVAGSLTSSRLDTVTAAEEMWKADAGCVISLGGDGTCRDVASAWPGVPMIAISTGTNNVFPQVVDGTAAGLAAGFIATGAVDLGSVGTITKRVTLRIEDPRSEQPIDEIALVEAALVATAFVGARAVVRPESIRWVAACIAEPASTGLSGIAGRVEPVGRLDDGGVLVRLGEGGRKVRVPLSPGTFSTVDIGDVERLPDAHTVELEGGGVIALDGERTTPVSADATVNVSIDRAGPTVIDVEHTLRLAAEAGRFDLPDTRKDADGD